MAGGPEKPYPYRDGGHFVLGPEIFASGDGEVICWRGENYVRQADTVALAVLSRTVRGWRLRVRHLRSARPNGTISEVVADTLESAAAEIDRVAGR